MRLTKIFGSAVIMFVLLLMCANVNAASYLPYNEIGRYVNMSEKPIPVIFELPNGSKKLINIVYYNGRVCVPLVSTLESMGGSLDKTNAQNFKISYNGKETWIPVNASATNRPVMVYKDGTAYISLYSLLTPFELVPVFDMNSNTISVYNKVCEMPDDTISKISSDSSAYIRFEDIMADGLDSIDNPHYTADRLEKLMYMADYMYARGQKFYIAWIPLYNNPATGNSNNVSIEYNLYNACFVYTLDYMIDHGGTIVMHGYTHQYGNDRSSVGYEWGDKTPFTAREQQQRMINAKTIASRLGYNSDIFEFPHYSATTEQLRMAEHYFKAIYQSYPKASVQNILTYTDTAENKRVYYIPTPADYVYHVADGENMLQRLRNSAANKQAVSLFYHPTLDIRERDYMTVTTDTENKTRSWYLSYESILSKLVNGVGDMGYSFGQFTYK